MNTKPIFFLLTLLFLTSCQEKNNVSDSGVEEISDTEALRAISSLVYRPASAEVQLGAAIPDMVPSSSGGRISAYSVSPALPAGISLNKSSGVISGVPSTAQAQTSYLVTASNSRGKISSSISIKVNSSGVYVAPYIDIADKSITLPTNSLSIVAEPKGNIVKYEWTKTSSLAATMNGASSATLVLTNLAQGSHQFKIVVTDHTGASDYDYVGVTVNPGTSANIAPTVVANDKALTLPVSSTSLVATASDSDGSIVSYAWTKVTTLTATMAGANSATLALSDLVQGSHQFKVTVTDNYGATAFDLVNVTVNAATANNQAPTVNAGADKALTLPTNAVNLLANATDPDGSIVSYAWVKTSGPTATSSGTETATLVVSNLVAGSYVFTVTVKDNYGATASDSVSVLVNNYQTDPTGLDASITLAQIPYTDPDIVSPGRGAEVWHNTFESINVPVEGQAFRSFDVYQRSFIHWYQLEGDTKGSFKWDVLDKYIIEAIQNNRKFSFGIMTLNTWGQSDIMINNAAMHYPRYVHEGMQKEAVKDWITSETWIPNWNSEFYLKSWEDFLIAVNQHLETGSYNGVAFKDVIGMIDVRGYGSWGEWHLVGVSDDVARMNADLKPKASSLIRIINAHVNAFKNFQLQAMLSTFDANRLMNTMVPPEVGYHALTVKNNVGLLGIRRDSWGATDGYLKFYMDENNTASYNGVMFKDVLMERWKFAPTTGEPMNGGTDIGGNCAYWDFENQVKRYRVSMVGNGNYIGLASATCAKDNLRAAFKAMGYRLVINGGKYNDVVQSDNILKIQLNWRNVGLTPTYENWDVQFELRNSTGSKTWSGSSSMALRLYLPEAADKVQVDTFNLPATLPTGTYSLHLIIKDPKGYRKPLPLAIKNQAADGSYKLGSVTIN